MKPYETRNVQLNLREATKDGVISGYASVFGNVDSYNSTFAPTAFNRTLAHSNGGQGVKILWQHNPFEPIGKPVNFKVDDFGLFMEARISDTPRGNEAITLINDGVLDGLSVGFNTLDYDFDDDGVMVIKEVRLVEVSVVTFPSNDLTRIRNVPVDEHARTLAELVKTGAEIPPGAIELHEAQIRSILTETHAPREQHAPRDTETQQALTAWRLRNRYGAQK